MKIIGNRAHFQNCSWQENRVTQGNFLHNFFFFFFFSFSLCHIVGGALVTSRDALVELNNQCHFLNNNCTQNGGVKMLFK